MPDGLTSTVSDNSVAVHVWRVLQDKCTQLKRIRASDMRRLSKAARKILGLNRSPKGKGYEKFLSDEEKRYIVVSVGIVRHGCGVVHSVEK